MLLIGPWRRARKLKLTLRDALEIERATVGVQQAFQIDEFIDVGEFKLTHDQLLDALEDLKVVPSERTVAILREARRMMGLS